MKNKVSKLKTPNDGAAAERAAFKRKVNALKHHPHVEEWTSLQVLAELSLFIETRTQRTAKYYGGLGRK